MVNKVEDELKAEDNELINAASNPAIANPFSPTGKKPVIMAGSAWSGLSREKSSIPFWAKA